MNSLILPKLLQNEPFEVAMGSYLVTTYSLIDSAAEKPLWPNKHFKDFMALSPKAEFAYLVAWNNTRDESDCSLVVLDNSTGIFKELFPIHSIPEQVRWEDDNNYYLEARVRPSVSGLKKASEYDLAKQTSISIKKDSSKYVVNFLNYI